MKVISYVQKETYHENQQNEIFQKSKVQNILLKKAYSIEHAPPNNT